MSPDCDIAWAAGFFDGEGSIGIERPARGYMLTLQVVQTRQAPLERLRALFGGTVTTRKIGPLGKRPMWAWRLHSRQAAAALRSMRPYLCVKRDEAVIAIAFQEQVLPRTGWNIRLTAEEIAARATYRDALEASRRLEASALEVIPHA